MPAPHIILIYRDTADGYEFPVASYYVHNREAAREDADAFVKRAVASGDFRPEGEIVFDRFSDDD